MLALFLFLLPLLLLPLNISCLLLGSVIKYEVHNIETPLLVLIDAFVLASHVIEYLLAVLGLLAEETRLQFLDFVASVFE